MVPANLFMTLIRSRSRTNAQHYHFSPLLYFSFDKVINIVYQRDKCIQFYKKLSFDGKNQETPEKREFWRA